MQDKEMSSEWVQLHTLITKENDERLYKLQGKEQMQKGIRTSKSTIINRALKEYLDYQLDKE